MKAASTIIQEREEVPAIEKGTLFFRPDQPRQILLCYFINREKNYVEGVLIHSNVLGTLGNTQEYTISSVVPFNGEIILKQPW
ncbi:hypothetical protein KNV38_gp078 [uncultured phage cr111_1]|uniref:Uncharacterized protein n=1 Tax=uncultured phage cr111_1 TaxID=2772071 RepID=A0A7M1RXV9_9CAUD|nr:hypothetical protein KNV38_gp078 [uncultured phage cr111_1]QOR59198.1 hypothetical protein [uncultured phage cr111_1]